MRVPDRFRPAFLPALFLVCLTAGVAGCATLDRLNPFGPKSGPRASECRNDQPYRDTASVPPLHPARGVEPPVSQAALRIPEPVADPVPFLQPVVEDGVAGTRCLDQPPPMAPATPPVPRAG